MLGYWFYCRTTKQSFGDSPFPSKTWERGNLNKPLESGLWMANNELLTVKEFLDLRL